MKLADLPRVQALSAREKFELVEELREDMARDLEKLEATAAEKQELDKRWAAFQRDPATALTLEEFKAKMAALRK